MKMGVGVGVGVCAWESGEVARVKIRGWVVVGQRQQPSSRRANRWGRCRGVSLGGPTGGADGAWRQVGVGLGFGWWW